MTPRDNKPSEEATEDLSIQVSDPVAELRGVSVDYGKFRALNQVTLTVPHGATGLIGRNGAGKSTLLRLLLGLVKASEGSGRVFGLSLSTAGDRLRQALGFMPENDAFVVGLRGVEQVALAGELCGLSARVALRRAHEVLGETGLGEARYRTVDQYSTGMRQRLKLAVALVHDPQLLLLDEPTVGLDPPGRRQMLELLIDLRRRHNKSLLISTHLLSDIEDTCETVLMLEKGRVITSGAADSIVQQAERRFRLVWEGDAGSFTEALTSQGASIESNGARPQQPVGERLIHEIQIALPDDVTAAKLFEIAHQTNVRLRTFEPIEDDLSVLYHRLIDAEGRDE